MLSLREKEFVEAVALARRQRCRIIFREILPNLVAPIIVYTTLFIPANILLEAALSFLGVGVADRASWGSLLAEAIGEVQLGLVVHGLPRHGAAADRARVQPRR